MNTEKLLKLADYIETVPASKFDMDVWARDPECKTAGCALGHACMMPEFAAEGLQLVPIQPRFELSPGLNRMNWQPFFSATGQAPAMPASYYEEEYHPENAYGMHAGMAFFDLTLPEAEAIFDPSTYEDEDGDFLEEVTREVVVQRIRDLVSGEFVPVGTVVGEF